MGQVFVNSYGSSQISAKGLFGSNQTINEIIVPQIDTTKINAGALINGIYKSREPKSTDISPISQASQEVFDTYFVYRQKITAENATSITITFDKLNLSGKCSTIFIQSRWNDCYRPNH